MSFQVPDSYAALFDAGRLDYWAVPYASMSDDQREARYTERRRQVLWLEGVEWDLERSPAQIAANPESDDALPGLVHFAGNGGGDSYSWYLPWQDGPEPPVLFCPHDSTAAEYYAPDFARCLERLWLHHGAWCERDARDAVLEDLRSWLGIIGPHLEPGRRAALEALAAGASPAEFRGAEAALVASWPRAKEELKGHSLLSTKYTLEYLGERALRLYDESIAFYERLVAEGHARFAERLADTRRNREEAVAALARKKPARPKKKAAPKAKKAAPKAKKAAPKAAPKKRAAPKAKKAAPKKRAAPKAAPKKKAAPKAKKAAPRKKAAPKAAPRKKAAPKAKKAAPRKKAKR